MEEEIITVKKDGEIVAEVKGSAFWRYTYQKIAEKNIPGNLHDILKIYANGKFTEHLICLSDLKGNLYWGHLSSSLFDNTQNNIKPELVIDNYFIKVYTTYRGYILVTIMRDEGDYFYLLYENKEDYLKAFVF